MNLQHDLTGTKAKLLELCYIGIANAKDNLIEEALYKNLDPEETCDVPQSIREILVSNSAIDTILTLNNTLCSDLDKT